MLPRSRARSNKDATASDREDGWDAPSFEDGARGGSSATAPLSGGWLAAASSAGMNDSDPSGLIDARRCRSRSSTKRG